MIFPYSKLFPSSGSKHMSFLSNFSIKIYLPNTNPLGLQYFKRENIRKIETLTSSMHLKNNKPTIHIYGLLLKWLHHFETYESDQKKGYNWYAMLLFKTKKSAVYSTYSMCISDCVYLVYVMSKLLQPLV